MSLSLICCTEPLAQAVSTVRCSSQNKLPMSILNTVFSLKCCSVYSKWGRSDTKWISEKKLVQEDSLQYLKYWASFLLCRYLWLCSLSFKWKESTNVVITSYFFLFTFLVGRKATKRLVQSIKVCLYLYRLFI